MVHEVRDWTLNPKVHSGGAAAGHGGAGRARHSGGDPRAGAVDDELEQRAGLLCARRLPCHGSPLLPPQGHRALHVQHELGPRREGALALNPKFTHI